VTVGLSVTVVGVIVLDERAATGASRLAEFTTSRVFLTRLGVAAVAVLAGFALAVLTRRLDARIRAAQHEVLRAMGWTGTERRRAHAAEAAAVALPALLVTAAACAALARVFAPDGASPALLAGIGTAAAALVGALTLRSPRPTAA